VLCVCVCDLSLFLQTALHLAAAGDHVDAVINPSIFTPTQIQVCTGIYKYIHAYTPASRRRAPARLRQPKLRMRLAVLGVPKGALRTHSA